MSLTRSIRAVMAWTSKRCRALKVLMSIFPISSPSLKASIDPSGSQTNQVVVLGSTNITSSTGDVYQISVEIGQFDWKPVGDYHDTISFEIEAY
jgi:hypothetical protein